MSNQTPLSSGDMPHLPLEHHRFLHDITHDPQFGSSCDQFYLKRFHWIIKNTPDPDDRLEFYGALYPQTPPDSQLQHHIAKDAFKIGTSFFKESERADLILAYLKIASAHFHQDSPEYADCVSAIRHTFDLDQFDPDDTRTALLFLIQAPEDFVDRGYYEFMWDDQANAIEDPIEKFHFLNQSLDTHPSYPESFCGILNRHLFALDDSISEKSYILPLATRLMKLTDDYPELQADCVRLYHASRIKEASQKQKPIAYVDSLPDLMHNIIYTHTPRYELFNHYIQLHRFEHYQNIQSQFTHDDQKEIDIGVAYLLNMESRNERRNTLLDHADKAYHYAQQEDHHHELIHATIIKKSLSAWPQDPNSPYTSLQDRMLIASYFSEKNLHSPAVSFFMNNAYLLYQAIKDCTSNNRRITDFTEANHMATTVKPFKSFDYSSLYTALAKPN
jgi:hypothetical protein